MKPNRVLLIDDHALVRAGVRALLGSHEGVEVVGEAAGGREALRLIEELQPDIVLLDIAMPAVQALRAGAAGYLPKSAASTELHEAIDTVARGENYVSGEVARETILQQAKGTGDEYLLKKLTPRQREILILMAEGNSTRHIAAALRISMKTVESHRAQLMERLNIHEMAGLVRYAIRMGLVRVE